MSVSTDKDSLILSVKPPKKNDALGLPGYDKDYVETIPEQENLCSVCWNCTNNIKQEVNLPIKYEGGSFYVYGHFCCFECIARYLLDNYHNQEMWEKYVLLNHYANMINGTEEERVLPAPDKRMLQKFGGEMSFDEYHSESSMGFTEVALPPIFPTSHIIHGNDPRTKHTNDANSDLRLYRKKTLKKNTIISKMNINQGTHKA